jgi:tetratricopeptide (TPR) repeat protein
MKRILLISAFLGVVTILLSICKVRYLVSTVKLELQIYQNPSDFKAYYNRATIKRQCNDFKGSLEDLNQVIKISPDDANAYHQRGRLHQSIGDSKGALEDYQKSAEIYARKGKFLQQRWVLDDIERVPPEL